MDVFDLFDWADRLAYLALATAYLAGGVLAIVFWSRHPRPSLFLLIACGLLLANELAYIMTWFHPDDEFIDFDVLPALDTVTPFARLIAFALMVLAVLTGRGPRRSDFDDV